MRALLGTASHFCELGVLKLNRLSRARRSSLTHQVRLRTFFGRERCRVKSNPRCHVFRNPCRCRANLRHKARFWPWLEPFWVWKFFESFQLLPHHSTADRWHCMKPVLTPNEIHRHHAVERKGNKPNDSRDFCLKMAQAESGLDCFIHAKFARQRLHQDNNCLRNSVWNTFWPFCFWLGTTFSCSTWLNPEPYTFNPQP